MSKQVCKHCGKPSIPGLVKGAGMCQYHWDKFNWGKEWADKCEILQKAAKDNCQDEK